MTSTPTLLPPSPLGLGGVFSTTFEIFKRRFGLFLGLGLLPVLAVGAIATIFVIALTGLFVATLIPLFRDFESVSSSAITGMIVALVFAVLLYMLMLFVMMLVQYRIQAMTVVAASDLTQGRNPMFGELGPRTKGFISRFLTVALLLVGAVALISILIFVVAGISFSQQLGRGADAAGVITMVALIFLLSVGAVYVSVRLWYLLPVLALERFSGMQALRRTWQLSGGNFWRILGHILVLSVAISVPTLAIYVPVTLQTGMSGRPNDDVASILTNLVGSLLIMAVSILTGPFQVSFQTVMYLDQLRRGGEPLPVMPPPVAPAQMPAMQYPPYQQPPTQYPPAPVPYDPNQYGTPNSSGGVPQTPASYPQASYPPPSPAGDQNGAPPRHAAPTQDVSDTNGPDAQSPFEPPRHASPPNGFGEPLPPSGNGRPTD